MCVFGSGKEEARLFVVGFDEKFSIFFLQDLVADFDAFLELALLVEAGRDVQQDGVLELVVRLPRLEVSILANVEAQQSL